MTTKTNSPTPTAFVVFPDGSQTDEMPLPVARKHAAEYGGTVEVSEPTDEGFDELAAMERRHD